LTRWLIIAALWLPLAAQGQNPPRVGVMLMQSIDGPFPQAFREGLRELGYVEGRNIRLELRSTEGDASRLAAIATDFVTSKVDVIVAGGGTVSARAAARLTNTIPIVFPVAADPVGIGLVKTLARPGTNLTGLALLQSEMNAKRVQLVRELMPKAKRVAVIGDPAMSTYADGLRATREAAQALSMDLMVFSSGTADEAQAAFKAAKDGGAEAMIVLPSSALSMQSRRLAGVASQHRLVTVWEHRLYTDAGGLVSYGDDIAAMYRSAARYVDRILKGAKPSELPVEQATKFDLVVNMKTAKALGVSIPAGILVRADLVIE
jgi:putative tryptophan/tyrosine transport system substrate-binding protein